MQGTRDEWVYKLDRCRELVQSAAEQPRLAAGLASSGLLAMMLQDAAALGGADNDATDLVRLAACSTPCVGGG